MTMLPLVAIVGTGRNGSTLISRLLDGIPGWFMYPSEVNFLQAMNDIARFGVVRRRVNNNSLSHRLGSLERPISQRALLRYYRPQLTALANEYFGNTREPHKEGPDAASVLQANDCYRPAEFVPAFLEATARWAAPDMEPIGALFKTIETPYIADYERLFPEMRFIHIIRDPIQVWSAIKRSHLKKKGKDLNYFGSNALVVFLEKRWLPHARALIARLDDPRHVLVRYEDLVADADACVTATCRRAGLPMPAEPKVLTVLGGRHFSRMPANSSQKGVATPETVTASMAEKFGYESVVTDRERDLILLRCWEPAVRLGYFADAVRPDAALVTRAWKERDEWDGMNLDTLGARLWTLLCHWRRYRYVTRSCRRA